MATPQQPRTARRAQLAVTWLFFLCGFGGANVTARLPSLAVKLALDEQTLGLVLLCGALGALLAFRCASSLMGRFGSAGTAVGAGILGAVFLVGPALASQATDAALALGLIGAFSGLLNVSMNVQGLAVERLAQRPIMSSLHGVCSLGSLIGAGLGAWVTHAQIGLIYHLGGVALAVTGPTVLSLKPLLPDAAATDEAAHRRPLALRGPLFIMGIIALCSSIGEGAMADWIGLYLFRDLNQDVGKAGLGYVAFSVAMVTGRLWGDRLWGHRAPAQVLALAGLCASVGLGLGLIINSYWSILMGTAVVGLGLGPTIPSVLRATGALFPTGASRAFAQVASVAYTGFLIGPPLIGFFAHRFGLRIGLVLVVFACGLIPVFTRRLEPSS